MTQTIDTDVIVLGGGAAGLMCAAVAGARGRRVQVLEKTRRVGKKILMSGGGRCNFTNLYSGPANFLSANPHYCKSALARYTPADFIALVEAHGIAYHEKERGQLFCDHSSKQIVRLLLDECERAGVAVHTEVDIRNVARADNGNFRVDTGAGVWTGAAVVVATGGLSIPKMGASGFGFDLARRFGLAVREPRPALVPFTLAGQQRESFAELSGLGLDVEAHCHEASFDAGMLFTHRGLSGPAMLQVSSYWQAGDSVGVDFLPGVDARAWLAERREARPDARLSTVLAERLPKRLAVCLCRDAGAARLGDARLKSLSEDELTAVAARLADWRFRPDGTEGYRTAEVTIGGVDTAALSSATMAARDVPGLYFIGEVVDVTGHLGGHNFQWAWASANAAGQVV
ncbi:NAD(P)/FAD-dependent oxidoreductase [Salinisphaera sp. LB1]|uniref:NAD(P)/FAD-dependent oxidoreductase n=1 Tax=Salinisphaera sp. LB1 TaxID=2183911 RepID=UPI000D70557F|nr:NAD(P)/FAD-dependent oxidoreductase [Salinisphaera sp. LB1]AWN16384.1 NAD(FAD)-utilizing dehydrogenase [Salinisphaera sp. LB1]